MVRHQYSWWPYYQLTFVDADPLPAEASSQQGSEWRILGVCTSPEADSEVVDIWMDKLIEDYPDLREATITYDIRDVDPTLISDT
jgi:hypothetical protein